MHPLTCSCFLLPLLGRLFLLAPHFLLEICLRSRWGPPFLFHALALIPLSPAKVQLSPILTFTSLMIWCFGQTALFLFLLVRAAPAARAAPSSLPFLFSYYLTLVLFSPPCPLLHLSSHLKLCGRSGMNCLLSPSVLSGYNGSPDTRFSWGTTRLMSWPNWVRYLRPPQSLVVSLLLPLLSTLVFSRTGGILSHQSILTHRFPRFPLRNLCSLVMLAVSSLVFTATDTAFC